MASDASSTESLSSIIGKAVEAALRERLAILATALSQAPYNATDMSVDKLLELMALPSGSQRPSFLTKKGAAPAGKKTKREADAKKCTAHSKLSNKPCTRFALEGSEFCASHGGAGSDSAKKPPTKGKGKGTPAKLEGETPEAKVNSYEESEDETAKSTVVAAKTTAVGKSTVVEVSQAVKEMEAAKTTAKAKAAKPALFDDDEQEVDDDDESELGSINE